MRGPLARPPVPIARSRREDFEDLVVDAAERIEAHLARERDLVLTDVAFAVEDMPFFPPGEEPDVVPFGRVEDSGDGHGPLVVVYRRTLELRSDDDEELAELVHDAVVEQVAELLGLDVDDVDPGYPGYPA